MKFSKVFSIVLLLFFLGPARAIDLTPQQKIQYIQAATQAAEEASKEDESKARMVLWAAAGLIQPFLPYAGNPQLGGLVLRYKNLEEQLWPKADAGAERLFAVWKTKKSRMMELARLFDTENNLPNGVWDYRERIAQILGLRDATWKEAAAMASSFPPPTTVISDPTLFQKIHLVEQITPALYHIVFGPAVAYQHATQRVVPETTKDVEKGLAKAAESSTASDIWRALADVNRGLDVLKKIDDGTFTDTDDRIAGLRTKISELTKKRDTENARAEELMNKEIDANRVPVERWRGGHRDKLARQIAKAYEEAFKGEKVKRVSIQSEKFDESWIAEWHGDDLLVGYAGFLEAAVAVEQPNGDHRVFFAIFSRTRRDDGTWTPLRFHEIERSYLIRPENIMAQ